MKLVGINHLIKYEHLLPELILTMRTGEKQFCYKEGEVFCR